MESFSEGWALYGSVDTVLAVGVGLPLTEMSEGHRTYIRPTTEMNLK